MLLNLDNAFIKAKVNEYAKKELESSYPDVTFDEETFYVELSPYTRHDLYDDEATELEISVSISGKGTNLRNFTREYVIDYDYQGLDTLLNKIFN